MTPLLVVVIVILAVALLALAVLYARAQRPTRPLGTSGKRILFPFAGRALSQRALDAALRLARAEEATLVPAWLVRVPMQIPLDGPRPRQCANGMPLLEAVEHRAVALGVPVDARSGAVAPTATRCATSWRTSATTASSSPPLAPIPMASTATTSPGCSIMRPARS